MRHFRLSLGDGFQCTVIAYYSTPQSMAIFWIMGAGVMLWIVGMLWDVMCNRD